MILYILSGVVAFALWSITDTSLKPDDVRNSSGKITFWGVLSMVLVQIVLWTLVSFLPVWIVPHLPQFFLTGWRLPIIAFGTLILRWFALLMILQYAWVILRATFSTAIVAATARLGSGWAKQALDDTFWRFKVMEGEIPVARQLHAKSEDEERRDVFPALADGQKASGRTISLGLAPTIGPYRLDMKTTDALKLVELTPIEKQSLNVAFEFKSERIYHAPHAEFADASWDIILGAVDGRVYKISALLIDQKSEQGDAMWRKLRVELRTLLGAPASTTAKITVWDTEDGNVVLNCGESGNHCSLVLTLTSRAVRDFRRRASRAFDTK